jgi:hypothetical protein
MVETETEKHGGQKEECRKEDELRVNMEKQYLLI